MPLATGLVKKKFCFQAGILISVLATLFKWLCVSSSLMPFRDWIYVLASEVAEREFDTLPYADFSLKMSGALLHLPHTS
jgi:hypothetical protein